MPSHPSCPSFVSHLRRAAFYLLMVLALPALAEEVCSVPDADGVQSCRAGLPAARSRLIVATQEKTQWCWAASISMIFAHYGFVLRQRDVVEDAYGADDDLPARSGDTLTHALSKTWGVPGDGTFSGSTVVSDGRTRQHDLTNDMVLAELGAGHPLLVGARGHAMVLVALRFRRSAGGAVRIEGGTVIDPAPGRGIRDLEAGELRPSYVAAVRVSAGQPGIPVAAASTGDVAIR